MQSLLQCGYSLGFSEKFVENKDFFFAMPFSIIANSYFNSSWFVIRLNFIKPPHVALSVRLK
jgi:hypothetical protein